jgi:hypothetical protein
MAAEKPAQRQGEGITLSTYIYDLPATSEQLQAIGMVASEWSYLESIVETAIWELAYVGEDVGRAITTHVGMRARLDMLRTLFRLRSDDEEAATKLDKLCERIDRAARKRNELVHALWVRGDYGSPMTLTVMARGTLQRERTGKHAKEIESVAALIADRSRALQEFLEAKGVVSPA